MRTRLLLSLFNLFILTSLNGKAQWNVIFGNANSLLSQQYIDVEFIDQKNGYVIGENGKISMTYDGGKTWPDTSMVTNCYLNQLDFINNDTGYVIDCIGNLFISKDHGLSWALIYQGGFTYIHFVDAKVGYAAKNTQVLKTNDGGASWNAVMSLNGYISSIYFTSNDSGFISSSNDVLKTTNGGTGWNAITGLNGVTGEFEFINYYVGFATYDSILYKTIDGGLNWTISLDNPYSQKNYYGDNLLAEISFVNDTIGYVAEAFCESKNDTLHIFKTIDGGKNWNELNCVYPDSVCGQMKFFHVDTGFCFTGYAVYKIENASICNDSIEVWPGDANTDKTVSIYDVLNIGIAYNKTGTMRTGASLNWTAQPATKWNILFSNNTDFAHADCDGNGTVNADDTVAVLLNYGQTHLKNSNGQQNQQASGTIMYLGIPNGPIFKGTKLSIPIYLGSPTSIATDVYGLAFDISYDSSLIYKDSISVSFANSWLGTNGVDLLSLSKNVSAAEQFDIATTRTDLVNKTGYGIIGELNVVTSDNISGKTNIANLQLAIENIKLISANETELEVTIDTTLTWINEQTAFNNFVTIFPNPAKDILYLTTKEAKINSIKVFNSIGKILFVSEENNTSSLNISCKNFEAGIYLLQVETNAGILIKKFAKQ